MEQRRATVKHWAEELGPTGPGFVVCEQFLDTNLTEGIQEELCSSAVTWVTSEDSTDQTGNPVTQKFDVFSHKLSYGDQDILQDLPTFKSLGSLIVKEVVQPLSATFPFLKSWEPDEITAQRYRSQVGELSWHRDLERHPGIIAVSNIYGSAELGVRQHMETSTVTLNEGDVLLLRAPLLFDEQPVGGDVRPQHAVTAILGSKHRISVTVRANRYPQRRIKNFYYNNWQ